jgi:tight adherence protein B
MAFDDLQILSAAVFCAVVLLIAGLHILYMDGTAGRRTVNRRLRTLTGGTAQPDTSEILRRKPRGRIGILAHFTRWPARLDRLVAQAGYTVPVRRVALVMGAITVFVFAAVTALTGGGGAIGSMVTALAAVSFGIGATMAGLMRLRARRMARCVAQLPEALDIMVRSLRAGHPVNAAMALVGREMAAPLAGEFRLAVDEMTYGLDLRDALANMIERLAVPDLQYVAAAIKIQHETGGNLAEILHGLATVIRARMRMLKKTRALSAEGRLSAHVLAAMPVIFAGLVYVSRPEFYLSASADPLFFPIVGAALGLELFGVLVMWRLVNYHV